MIKHLYQRTILHKGKKVKAWYFWFYDEKGKQVRKTCGVNGKPCLIKRDALMYIELLDDNKLLKKEVMTIKEFCKGFYDEDSLFLKKQKAKNIVYKEETIKSKRMYLHYFVEKFGSYKPDEISIIDVEDWLISLDKSNTWRNSIITEINIVYQEMYNKGLVKDKLIIERFHYTSSKKGILTPNEIQKLFPLEAYQIINIWRRHKTWTDYDAYQFATLVFTTLTTGMRISEIIALQWNQFLQENVILLNAMIDKNRKRVDHLKKGNSENKKWRITVLPQKTVYMINTLRNMRSFDSEYVFEKNGDFFWENSIRNIFYSILSRNGINCKERNIKFHSLRYTYNTIMRREINNDDLRLMMGHENEQMTAYYDRSSVTDNMPHLLQNKDIIDSLWN